MGVKIGKREVVPFMDFLGGLNDTSTPDHMKDNELEQADNISLDTRGGFSYREGTININKNSFKNDVMYLIEFPMKDGSIMDLAVMKDKKLYEITGGVKKEIAKLNSYNIDHAIYRNAVYILDGKKFRAYGEVDYTTQSGTISIEEGDIVENSPISEGSNPGELGRFYKALFKSSSVDLSKEDLGDTSKWEDVTHKDFPIPDIIKEVKKEDEKDNDFDPIHKCRYIEVHPESHRFFVSGNPDDVSCLYFSESGMPGYFKSTNRLYPTGGEGEVKALTSILQSILVGYRRGWWTYTGIDDEDWRWYKLPIPYGPVNNSVLELTPSSIMFYSDNGIYKMSMALIDTNVVVESEDVYLVNVSDGKVNRVINSIGNKKHTRAVFNNNKFYLSYSESNSETSDRVLVYDFILDSFTRYTDLKINHLIKKADGDVYFGSKNYVMKFDRNELNDIDENGEPVPIKLGVKTKRFSFNTPFNVKLLHRFFILTTQGVDIGNFLDMWLKVDYSLTERYEIDLNNESFIWGMAPWGKVWGIADLGAMEMHLRKKGIRCQAIFKGNITNTKNAVVIPGIAFDISYLRAKVKTMGQKRLLDEKYTEID